MQARELFHSVDAYDGREADCLVTGAIDHLEEVDSGARVSVEVALSARLIDLHTGEVLWRGSASKIEALDQRSVPGVVDAMSRELGEVADELVGSMRNGLATKPSASRPSGNQR
jgi:cell wall assembly regulator SMI1